MDHCVGFRQWRRALIDWVDSDQPDLSNRQMAMLLIVTGDSTPHTVRGLAVYLNLSKPVISRGLDRLIELGYLSRLPDENDGRNVFFIATDPGRCFVDNLARDFQ